LAACRAYYYDSNYYPFSVRLITEFTLSDNGSLTDSLSVAEMMNQKKSLNIGEGGPSQWAQDKTDRTQKKGDDSSDSEEEEVVQLTSTEVD
jgi:hypothetical protein